jgi:hypothetical protein
MRDVFWVLVVGVVLCGSGACSGGGGGESAASPFERYSSLSATLGCNAPERQYFEFPDECDPLAIAWIDCIERDLTQCYCESSGDANCEGSYKPNEGPALCVDEFHTMDACIDPP